MEERVDWLVGGSEDERKEQGVFKKFQSSVKGDLSTVLEQRT